MNVTHIYRDSYPPQYGGIEQHMHTLVHQLKHHIRPDLLVSGRSRANWNDDGVPIQSLGAWGRFQGAPLSPDFPLAIRRRKADLLHFHMANPTGELAYLLSGTGVPGVATYHHDIVRQAAALKVYRPFLERFLSRVQRIIVATPQHITSSEILPRFKDKCRVIPYGIDIERFRATPAVLARAEALRAQHGSRIVLFVGKLRYYKGLEYLIRAMAQVEGRLLLLGRGTEEARLRALTAELKLDERVLFLPHVEDVEFLATLHACDVFALPSISRMEMFGIAQLEAQACGKPVICTALGTGVEYVNLHEKTGLVVPPRDVDALAGALDRLLGDPELGRSLGQAAYMRASEKFSQVRMTASTLCLYNEILGIRNS